MNIKGARSYILIEFDHRTVKIAGELTTTPVFFAYLGSIVNWEPPFENVEVTKEEKLEIVRKVTDQNNPDFRIIFEE